MEFEVKQRKTNEAVDLILAGRAFRLPLPETINQN